MYKIILPAQEIPTGSEVTKINGTNVFTIKDHLKIFNLNNEATVIESDDGVRFLISSSGNTQVVSGNTELVWRVERGTLIDYLEERD